MSQVELVDLFKELQSVITETSVIELFLSEQWGSQNPPYRLEIRQQIQNWISQKNNSLDSTTSNLINNLLDLNHPPKLFPIGSVSISHTQNLGGFIATLKDHDECPSLGFDIEHYNRVNEATVKRVCSNQEVNEAPNVKYLWCAKEALFKASQNENPTNNKIKVISEIEISNWQKISQSWYQADFRGTEKKVWTTHNQIYLMSIALF